MSLQPGDGGVALALVARRDDEDERLALRPGVQKFVNQPGADSEAKATADGSMGRERMGEGMQRAYLFAPVTRT